MKRSIAALAVLLLGAAPSLATSNGNASVTVERKGAATFLKGDPATLRKIVFWTGDAVWPEWASSPLGRKTYLGYADQCEDGSLAMFNRNYFDKAWPQVRWHLAVDGVRVFRAN